MLWCCPSSSNNTQELLGFKKIEPTAVGFFQIPLVLQQKDRHRKLRELKKTCAFCCTSQPQSDIFHMQTFFEWFPLEALLKASKCNNEGLCSFCAVFIVITFDKTHGDSTEIQDVCQDDSGDSDVDLSHVDLSKACSCGKFYGTTENWIHFGILHFVLFSGAFAVSFREGKWILATGPREASRVSRFKKTLSKRQVGKVNVKSIPDFTEAAQRSLGSKDQKIQSWTLRKSKTKNREDRIDRISWYFCTSLSLA